MHLFILAIMRGRVVVIRRLFISIVCVRVICGLRSCGRVVFLDLVKLN